MAMDILEAQGIKGTELDQAKKILDLMGFKYPVGKKRCGLATHPEYVVATTNRLIRVIRDGNKKDSAKKN